MTTESTNRLERVQPEPSEPAPRHAAPRNPGPRPALRFEGDEHSVVAARPLPGQGDPVAGADDGGSDDDEAGSKGSGRAGHGERRKGKGGDKGEKGVKRSKADKERRRRKTDKKRPKAVSAAAADVRRSDDRFLVVNLPEEFRRALERAAGEHGLTPEGLAAFVLVEWLDR